MQRGNVGIALLGVGPMAAQHARAIAAAPGITIHKSVSRDPAKAAAFAAEHGISCSEGLTGFLAKPEVDGVCVVTPADAMLEVALELTPLGLPLLLEKPVGLNPRETAKALAAVSVPHMVGLNRRFYDVLREGRAVVEAAGGLKGIEVQMPENIAPLAERYSQRILDHWAFGNSVHMVDLLRFFGGEIGEVHALRTERSWSDRSIVATMKFQTGALGVFHAHWGAPGGWRLTLAATDIQIVFQPIERGLVLKRAGAPEAILPSDRDTRFKAGLMGQAVAFGDLIRTGQLSDGASDLADYARSVGLVATLFGVPSE